MKVSVIVPTYNRAHMITEAIESVLSQTFKDFELIIVDNYSTDDTESIVKSYVDKRIRYFKNQNNGLVSINRNYGIQKSGGEYIAFLDDDDLWLPEKLEKQVELLDSSKQLGLVYSNSYVIDSNGYLRETTYLYGMKPARGSAFNELFRFNFIPTLTVAIRREVLDKVGEFNPRYKICQDYDLWLRIAEYYPIDFVEQPLAKFRVHGGSIYQKNTVLSYQELLQVIEYWVNRNPELKRELGHLVRLRRGLTYCLPAILYVYRHKNKEAVKQFTNFVKYWLVAKA